LNNNRISKLDGLGNLGEIRILNLANNKIKSLSSFTFQNSKVVIWL